MRSAVIASTYLKFQQICDSLYWSDRIRKILYWASMKRPSRDPGIAIKQKLRREVNFGCPVRFHDGSGCGSPILTFHHFDPPWAGNFVHCLDGMVALCPLHHTQADGGLFSKSQLRAFKRSPFVDDAIKVQWPWQPEKLVMKVGPSLIMGSGSAMRLNGRPVMHFRPVEIEPLSIRTVQFDADVRDEQGKPWLRIEESWFDLRLDGTTELIFTPQTKTFRATHGDTTFLDMRFDRMPLDRFKKWLPSFMSNPEIAVSAAQSAIRIGAVDSEGQVSIVTFEGRFRSKEVEVIIMKDRMTFRSFLPGLEEQFDWHSWVVDSEQRAILRIEKGPEFFSLG